MTDCDVELLTNEELIEELLKRSTFLGVIVRSVESIKGDRPITEFAMSHSDIGPLQLARILFFAMKQLKQEAA